MMFAIIVSVFLITISCYSEVTALLLCSKDVNKVTYKIYNSDYPDGTSIVSGEVGKVLPNNDVYLIAHAWTRNSRSEWVVEGRTGLLALYPTINVITIEYKQPYASDPLYLSNLCTSPYVGDAAADLFVSLAIPTSLIKCTGHSMGAQVCGEFGRRFIALELGQIVRITSLDAAGPGYDFFNMVIPTSPRESIGQSDAQKVVGVYTDASGLGFGMRLETNYSHVGIVINGGRHQPCDPLPLCVISSVFSLSASGILHCFSCSHLYAREFYWRAVRGIHKYVVTKCDSYEKYANGECNSNEQFVYTEELPTTVSNGFYHIRINKLYEQIAYNAP